MYGLLEILQDLLLLNLMTVEMLKIPSEHLMAGQFAVYEPVLNCHLVCHVVETTEEVAVMTEVVAAEAGVVMMIEEEVEMVATVVAVTGLDQEVQEEAVDTQEVEVVHQDEDATEALEEAAVDPPTTEEKEVYHHGDHPVLGVMTKVEAVVGLPNRTEEAQEGEALIPMEVTTKKGGIVAKRHSIFYCSTFDLLHHCLVTFR